MSAPDQWPAVTPPHHDGDVHPYQEHVAKSTSCLPLGEPRGRSACLGRDQRRADAAAVNAMASGLIPMCCKPRKLTKGRLDELNPDHAAKYQQSDKTDAPEACHFFDAINERNRPDMKAALSDGRGAMPSFGFPTLSISIADPHVLAVNV